MAGSPRRPAACWPRSAPNARPRRRRPAPEVLGPGQGHGPLPRTSVINGPARRRDSGRQDRDTGQPDQPVIAGANPLTSPLHSTKSGTSFAGRPTGADRWGDHRRPRHRAQRDRLSHQPARGQSGAVASPGTARPSRAPALPAQEARCHEAGRAPPDRSTTKPSRPAAVQNQLICALKPSQPRRTQGAPIRRSGCANIFRLARRVSQYWRQIELTIMKLYILIRRPASSCACTMHYFRLRQ